MRFISAKVAGYVLLVALSLLVLFHVSILIHVVPDTFIWGGKIADANSMQVAELIALSVSGVFLSAVFLKLFPRRIQLLNLAANALIWILFVFLLLNTLGNLLSSSGWEKSLSIVTLILAILALRLALAKSV